MTSVIGSVKAADIGLNVRVLGRFVFYAFVLVVFVLGVFGLKLFFQFISVTDLAVLSS